MSLFSSLRQVCCGVRTRVLRGSRVLNASHVDQLESALPTTHQCYDWRLLYRLSRDGASLHTLLLSARNHTSYLLVVKVRAASI